MATVSSYNSSSPCSNLPVSNQSQEEIEMWKEFSEKRQKHQQQQAAIAAAKKAQFRREKLSFEQELVMKLEALLETDKCPTPSATAEDVYLLDESVASSMKLEWSKGSRDDEQPPAAVMSTIGPVESPETDSASENEDWAMVQDSECSNCRRKSNMNDILNKTMHNIIVSDDDEDEKDEDDCHGRHKCQ